MLMWWKPVILDKEPGPNIKRQGYVKMYRVLSSSYEQDVYCEDCIEQTEKKIRKNNNDPHAERIVVWVEAQGQCSSCWRTPLAVDPGIIYELPVNSLGHRNWPTHLNQRYYVVAWGKFRDDGSYVTYCERCASEALKKEMERSEKPLKEWQRYHKIWVQFPFSCMECHSVHCPAADKMTDEVEMNKDQEARPKPLVLTVEEHKRELLGWTNTTHTVIHHLLAKMDEACEARKISEKAYADLILFLELSEAAARSTVAFRKEDLLEMEDAFRKRYETAQERTTEIEGDLESAYSQVQSTIEKMTYHTEALLLERGVDRFGRGLIEFVKEAVESAEMEHDAKIGEDQ